MFPPVRFDRTGAPQYHEVWLTPGGAAVRCWLTASRVAPCCTRSRSPRSQEARRRQTLPADPVCGRPRTTQRPGHRLSPGVQGRPAALARQRDAGWPLAVALRDSQDWGGLLPGVAGRSEHPTPTALPLRGSQPAAGRTVHQPADHPADQVRRAAVERGHAKVAATHARPAPGVHGCGGVRRLRGRARICARTVAGSRRT